MGPVSLLEDTPGMSCTEKGPCEDTEKTQPFDKPRREAPRESKSDNTLVLDLQPSQLRESKCCLSPSLWYVAMVTQADWYNWEPP